MFGLVVLIVMVLYLSLLAWATRRGWRWGIEKKGWTGKKRYLGAAIGFLVVYLPVFWDFIPTVAVHQYYCAKDAGFWVYKTLDQWKQENPGVMETLVVNKGGQDIHEGDMENFTATHLWNQRFNLVFIKKGPLLVNNWRHEQIVSDSKKNEVLARFVDFSTGNGHVGGEPELRFWLHSDGCIGSEGQATNFVKFAKQFRGAEK